MQRNEEKTTLTKISLSSADSKYLDDLKAELKMMEGNELDLTEAILAARIVEIKEAMAKIEVARF